MRRPTRTLHLTAALVAAVALAACSSWRGSTRSGPRWREDGRTARNLPTMFVADTINRDGRMALGSSCTARLVDPRDGNLLVLIRTETLEVGRFADFTESPTKDNVAPTRPAQRDARGDYSVEHPSRYGVAPGELLRMDCVSQRALGIVSRRW